MTLGILLKKNTIFSFVPKCNTGCITLFLLSNNSLLLLSHKLKMNFSSMPKKLWLKSFPGRKLAIFICKTVAQNSTKHVLGQIISERGNNRRCKYQQKIGRKNFEFEKPSGDHQNLNHLLGTKLEGKMWKAFDKKEILVHLYQNAELENL